MSDQQTKTLRDICIVHERSTDPLIKVCRLAYLQLPRPSLQQAEKFFTDFGLLSAVHQHNRIYMRTVDPSSHAIILDGSNKKAVIGLEANSLEDLHILAQHFAVPVVKRTDDDPLGGSYVCISDPENNLIELNYQLRQLPTIQLQDQRPNNSPQHCPRQNDVVRFKLRPPTVSKLGHTVFGVNCLQRTVHWYQNVLGFIVSDFQMLPGDPIPTVAFLRCDRGGITSDHHTLALGSAIDVGHLHTAFELSNVDEIGLSSTWLKQQGYKHSWGMGRHILGSQIFDYWRDPWGFQFEHYADGDVFDASKLCGYEIFNSHSLHQWGPPVSKDMLGKELSLGLLKTVLARLTSQGDLTFKRLRAMIKASS